MARRLFFALCIAGFALSASGAAAQSDGSRIEVIDVKGIIDGSVERAVIGGITEAQRDGAELVVLQIDSAGVLHGSRLSRITRTIRSADVPIAAWVGPPGAHASNGAAFIFAAADIRTMAPATTLGPIETLDLQQPDTSDRQARPFDERITADEAERRDVVEIVEPTVEAALDEANLPFDMDDARIRFHSLDLFGRGLHAAAQPSITYLLLLAGLVGIVFELFHPSNGPAGVSGLAALALAIFGVVTLGASWAAFALIVAGVAAFCVDLRYESLGPFSAGGLAALIAGSLLLFRSPWLRVSPWVLAVGIIGMVLFLVGAMTRVLRDLRLIARGELEVTDAHQHLEGGTDDA